MNTHEIIPVERGKLGLEVSSRLLHERLRVKTPYQIWIRRRLTAYNFEENRDFYFCTNLYKNKQVQYQGRSSIDYTLTLDTAKELAMLENNDTGRIVRRYFIEIEKRYRDWMGFVMPRLEIDYDLFGEREGYDYLQLLRSVGCSTGKSAVRSRIGRHRGEFWKSINGLWFVSKDYGKTIILYAIARRWSKEISQNKTIIEKR